jgi:hypothetical protein
MINDSLVQVGKDFDKDKKSTKHVTNRVTKVGPIVEKCKDLVGVLYTYSMEFYTYGEQNVSLTITFDPKYNNIFYGN